MKASHIVGICSKYFDGFNDLCKIRNPLTVIGGVGKVISYATIFIPIIFKIVECHYTRIHVYEKLDNELTKEIAATFRGVYQNSEVQDVLENNPNRFTNYLIQKLKQIGSTQRVGENPRLLFQEAFGYLSEEDKQIFRQKALNKHLTPRAKTLLE